MKKLLKKLGYGYAIHYNEYRDKFEVYKIGEYSPGTEMNGESKVTIHEDPKKAIKNHLKTRIKNHKESK